MNSHLPSIHAGREDSRPDRADVWLALYQHLTDCTGRLHGLTAEAAEAADLREIEFRLIWLVGQDGPSGIGQRDLARRLAVSDAQVSGLVERLKRRGLLRAFRCRRDRRRQLWQLDDAGRRLLADAMGQLDRRLALVSEQCDIRAVRELDGLLRRVTRAIDRRDTPLRRFDPDTDGEAARETTPEQATTGQATTGQATTGYQETPRSKEARQ